MATVNGSALPAGQSATVLDSITGNPEGGRAAPRPNPEVVARPKRRRFTAAFKQKVLAEADAAKGSGEIGAVLRRHGLYALRAVKEARCNLELLGRLDGSLGGPIRPIPAKIEVVYVEKRLLPGEPVRLLEPGE